jgi:hypothetical protein
MRQVQALITLLFLATALVDAAILSRALAVERLPDWACDVPTVTLYALILAQTGLVAAWAAFGRTPLPWRAMAAVLCAAFGALLTAKSDGVGSPERIATNTVLLLAQTLVIASSLWLTRMHIALEEGKIEWKPLTQCPAMAGYILCRTPEEVADVRSTGFSRNPGEQPPKGGTTNGTPPAARGTRRGQYTIRAFIAWMTALAVIFSVLRLAIPPRLLCGAREEVADVRSTGFSWNPGEQPPKGGTTNGVSLAARGIAHRVPHTSWSELTLITGTFVLVFAAIKVLWGRRRTMAKAATLVAALFAAFWIFHGGIKRAELALVFLAVQSLWLFGSLSVFRVIGYRNLGSLAAPADSQ